MLSTGTPIRVTSGKYAGMSGVILRGTVWRSYGMYRSGTLYVVHIDGTKGPSVKIWDDDLVTYLKWGDKHVK